MPPHFPPTPADRPSPGPTPGHELIAPAATAWMSWQQRLPDGQTAIVVRISTAHGPLFFFLGPDEATQIGGRLRQQGKAAKSGITLPPGVAFPDDDVQPTAGTTEDPATHPDDCALCPSRFPHTYAQGQQS